MKKNIYILLLFSLTVVLESCYGDKGNYDYEDVNEITVDLGGAKYTYVVGNVARLEPTLTFATQEIAESELEYNWTLNGEFISDKRVLEFTVEKIASQVECQLRVTNPKTGLTYIGRTAMDFTQKYNLYGWLVLSKDEQASYLNFMTATGADASIYDEHLKVYQEQNREVLPKETLGLLEHFRSGGSSSNPSSVWIVNPKATNCVDLEGAAFTKDLTLPDAFLEPGFTDNLKVKQIAELKWLTVVVDENGKAYTRKKLSEKAFHTGKFLSTPLSFEGNEVKVDRFLIIPEMRALNMPFVEGEKGHQRILALMDYDKQSAGKVLQFTAKEEDYNKNGFYDGPKLHDLLDYEIVYWGYARSGTSTSGGLTGPTSGTYVMILILKKGSEYLYQEYSVNKPSTSNQITVIPTVNKTIDFGNLLEGAIIYAAPYIDNRTYLLIAKGKKLYYADRTTINREEPILLKTFDAEVTALNAEIANSHQLGVGLANGKLFVLSLKTANLGEILGDPNKEEIERFYQVSGRIFDIRYRFKYSNGWT